MCPDPEPASSFLLRLRGPLTQPSDHSNRTPLLGQQIKSPAYFDEGFRLLETHLRELMDTLAEALPLDPAILGRIPLIRAENADGEFDHCSPEAPQVLSLAFELLNMVEENVAFGLRSRRRSEHGPGAVSGLWPHMLGKLSEAGCSEEEALEHFRKVRVEPVLTAHPTEAKRPEVREKHLAIYHKIVEWDAARSDPHRSRRLRSSLAAELEALWFTGEIFIRRPSVENELRNAVYYLREVFPDVVVRLDRSLEAAWQDHGWSLTRLREENAYPRVRFSTWIGGDRDGHPLVTAEVTARCLAELRGHAATLHGRWLRRAAESLPLAPPFIDCRREIRAGLTSLAESLGDPGRKILKQNRIAPWRAWLYLLREKMTRLPEDGGYGRSEDYRAELDLMHESLQEAGAHRCVTEFVRPLQRLEEVFSFHLAAMDVRQNSATHDQAFAEILQAASLQGGQDFPSWSEEKRIKFLSEELRNPRPLLARGLILPDRADNVLSPLRVLADEVERHGSGGLGQLIVSMTRQASDLLLVHLLAREAGLADFSSAGQWRAKLPVTPLFETGDDLTHADTILENYFAALDGPPASIQPAMVGYSDSNKDAGVFASQWGIHRALERISAVCEKAGSTVQCFHGRGGTIGRGAGPTHWFLRALPPASLAGPVRFTEQGEVLPRKYAHEGNAHYHLELLVAGVSAAVCTSSGSTSTPDRYREALDHISEKSTEAYRGLLETPGFVDFYRDVTPIDALEAGTFGSRPPRRTGSGGNSLDDLRAIPWVFSWTQSRFYLPGWFGVGSGLSALKAADPSAYRHLRETRKELPLLHYLLNNVESGLVSADPETMVAYGALCDDSRLRTRLLHEIQQEFDLTRHCLADFFGSDFSRRRPRLNRTITLRDYPLRCLHDQQRALLADWRQAGRPVTDPGKNSKFDPVFLALQLNINAIASGLRETG